ncbi:unnamed protein product [Arctogadus glacialis]
MRSHSWRWGWWGGEALPRLILHLPLTPQETGARRRREESSEECPICGKFMSHLRQHLTACHKVGNFEEKCLLMNWSSGRGKLSCRVCDKVGLSRLDKHLVDLHQLPPNEVEEQMLLQLVVVKLGELRQQGPLARWWLGWIYPAQPPSALHWPLPHLLQDQLPLDCIICM